MEIERIVMTSMSIPEQQRENLKTLFPEVFTEGGKIDWDKLRLTLGESVDVGKERFGMNWPGKTDCFKNIQRPSIATLAPDKDHSIDFDKSQNLFIEGDNLEALKLLQKSYLGRVKMIYIDPPYNTGHEFIYPDNFNESLETYLEYTGQVDSEGRKFTTNTETDGRFHSKWMNMIYPRLFLAKNLLKEDGIIFISIDDSEVNNLKIICNEIFGEENFVACLVYDKNRKNDAKFFSVGHEYMLVYFKDYQKIVESGTIFRIQKEGIDEVKAEFEKLKIATNGDWAKVSEGLKDFYSKWGKEDPRKPLARFTKVDAKGPFRDDGNISWPGGGGPKYEVIHPISKKPCKVPDAGWRFPTKKRMDEEIENGRVVFGHDETTLPRIRRNLFESDKEVMTSVHFSYAQTATMEFNKIFDNRRVFENPKNYNDLKRLIDYVTHKNDDDIILDFFAGSGTTAHAVMDLNNDDGGNRRFICIQLPEPCSDSSEASAAGYSTIADICRARLSKVIGNIKAENEKRLRDNKANLFGVPPTAQIDLGFKAFKLSPSNFKVWDTNTSKQAEVIQEALFDHVDHISPESKQDSILFELLLKSGFDLSTTIEEKQISGKRVFVLAEGQLLICLDKQLTNEVIKEIAEQQPSRVICLDEGFQNNDHLKTNAVQIMKSKGVLNFRTI